MRIKVSFPDLELSIKIEGPDDSTLDLIDLAVKTLVRMKEIVKEAMSKKLEK